MMIRGVPLAERMPARALLGVLAEGRDVPLWSRLTELRCPVLVIRGGRRGAVVSDEVAERWRRSLPTVDIATLADAGHDLWSRDPDAYLAVLNPFLHRVQGTVQATDLGTDPASLRGDVFVDAEGQEA